jgi:hypothetical protein
LTDRATGARGAEKREAVADTVERAVRNAPLWAHALALLVVLLALLPVAGFGVSYSADEGVAIIQASTLRDGDGWVVAHPFPEVDPSGELYPLEYATFGSDGPVAYAKHPAYPWLLSMADRVGGEPAMVVLSILGTWAAALAAAVLTRQISGGFGRTALWVAGVGSPLLFNAYWVIAHSLAAGAIGVAAALVLGAVATGAQAKTIAALSGAVLLAMAATLLRTEAAIFGIALGAGALLAGAWGRRLVVAVGGVLLVAGTLAAREVDDILFRRVVGDAARTTAAFEPRPRTGALSERIDGFVETWLRPAPGGSDHVGGVLALLATVLLVLAAVALVRGRRDRGLVLSVAAAGALVARAVAVPTERIPGLLLAFPLLLVGLVGLIRAPVWRSSGARSAVLLLGVVLAGWGGVLLTQYAEGGVAEWGGRYFAVGLPLAIPLAVVGTDALLTGAGPSPRRAITAALAVGLLSLSVASLRELRRGHDGTQQALARIDELADQAGERPVVVTDSAALPRLDWDEFDRRRWVLADPASHPDLPDRLAAAGVERWVLVSADVAAALDAFSDVEVRASASPTVVLVEHTGR